MQLRRPVASEQTTLSAFAANPRPIDWDAIDPATRASLAVQGIIDPRCIRRVRTLEQAQMHDPALRPRPIMGGIYL